MFKTSTKKPRVLWGLQTDAKAWPHGHQGRNERFRPLKYRTAGWTPKHGNLPDGEQEKREREILHKKK
jgi:hypothetical protein